MKKRMQMEVVEGKHCPHCNSFIYRNFVRISEEFVIESFKHFCITCSFEESVN